MSRALRVAATAALLCLLGGVAQAADEARVLRLRAEQLAAEDRCGEALPRAREARALAPDDDARAALVEGRCALRLGRYQAAIPALEDARRLDPELRGVSIDLAMAQYHAGHIGAAEEALDDAEDEMPDDARVSLYRGLVLLEGAKAAEAATAFERAGQLDKDLDPVASYYAGVAWEQERNRERAAEALQRVKKQSPDSPWAEQADLALNRLDQPYLKHYWAKAILGMDYDSNVVLRGVGLPLPLEISDEADGRGYWSLDTGWEMLKNPSWSVGLIPAYQGSAHVTLSQFDIQYPNLSLWVDRRVDEVSFVRLRPYGGYAWRDGQSYLGVFGGELSYSRSFGGAGTGRAFFDIARNDYKFDILGDPTLAFVTSGAVTWPGLTPAEAGAINADLIDDRKRDGYGYNGGYEHTLPLNTDSPRETTLRAGLSGGHYESRGTEYIHDSVMLWLRGRQELVWDVTLDLLGSYAYEPYEYPSTFQSVDVLALRAVGVRGGPNRVDHIWNVRMIFERPITENVKASLRWRYNDNDSNTDTYNFDRHIVGGFVTIFFGS